MTTFLLANGTRWAIAALLLVFPQGNPGPMGLPIIQIDEPPSGSWFPPNETMVTEWHGPVADFPALIYEVDIVPAGVGDTGAPSSWTTNYTCAPLTAVQPGPPPSWTCTATLQAPATEARYELRVGLFNANPALATTLSPTCSGSLDVRCATIEINVHN